MKKPEYYIEQAYNEGTKKKAQCSNCGCFISEKDLEDHIEYSKTGKLLEDLICKKCDTPEFNKKKK